MTADDTQGVLWDKQRIADWLDDHWLGVGSAEALAAEIIAEYETERKPLLARIAQLEQETVSLLVDCINYAISYGIGDEDGYRARYKELTGHSYGEDDNGAE